MAKSNSLKKQITKEYIKCAQDPVYFMKKYCYIQHQKHGKILFKLYPFQERTLKELEDYRYNVILKARQMGISTLVAGYSMWLMLFHNDKKILVVSLKRDVAKGIVEKTKYIHNNLPRWMKEETVEDNQLSLALSNGSKIWAESTGPNAGRSESLSLLILDEAAFIDKAHELWSAAKMTLDVGEGHAIVLSTPAGVGNWFHKVWSNAVTGSDMIQQKPEIYEGKGVNDFHPVRLHWTLHPDRDSSWRAEQDKVLGPKKAARECDTDFETSGDQVIDMDIIKWYEDNLIKDPIEKRLVMGSKDLWIWHEPTPQRGYVISADVARGDANDFSTFHVFDPATITQHAEYKGKIPPDRFADVLYTYGSFYNDALIIIERNSYGYSVLQKLINRGYKNILYTSNDLRLIEVDRQSNKFNANKKKMKPGLDTNRKTRPLIISKLNEYVRNKDCNIYSKRTIEEFKTFIWKGDKAVHMNGFNDDLILALSFNLWVRDTALMLDSKMRDLSRSTLGGISTGKGVYSTGGDQVDPYKIKHEGGTEDIRWLF